MIRSRVIRGIANGERWAGPVLDATEHTPASSTGHFRASSDESQTDPAVEFNQGHEEGFAKGYEEGKQAAQLQVAQGLAVLANLTAYVREPLAALDEQVDDELVRLVLAIARQVVRREVRTEPEQIVAVVREARGVLNDVRGNLTIAMHPEEATLVRAMFTADEALAGVVIEEDLSITRGGCTLRTETCFVDAQVEARIAQIAVGILGDERESRVEESDG